MVPCILIKKEICFYRPVCIYHCKCITGMYYWYVSLYSKSFYINFSLFSARKIPVGLGFAAALAALGAVVKYSEVYKDPFPRREMP